MAGYNKIGFGRGEPKVLRVTIDNPPDAGIAGWEFRFRLFSSPTSTTALVDKTTGFTITDNADTFEFLPATSDTSTLTPAVYWFRIDRSTGDRIAWGPLTISY